MDFKNGDKVWAGDTFGRKYKALYVGKDPRENEHSLHIVIDGQTIDGGNRVLYAETVRPFKTETRVKKASEIVKWLEEHGFDIDNDGVWEGPYAPHAIGPDMFQSCGLRPISDREYHPDWLEEVEI